MSDFCANALLVLVRSGAHGTPRCQRSTSPRIMRSLRRSPRAVSSPASLSALPILSERGPTRHGRPSRPLISSHRALLASRSRLMCRPGESQRMPPSGRSFCGRTGAALCASVGARGRHRRSARVQWVRSDSHQQQHLASSAGALSSQKRTGPSAMDEREGPGSGGGGVSPRAGCDPFPEDRACVLGSPAGGRAADEAATTGLCGCLR